MRKYNKGLTFLLITAFVLAVYVSAAGFKDIKETDWFAEALGKLSELDIVNGLPDGSFNPQGEVTRAQFIKMLVQAMEYKKIDSVSFIDMKPYPASKPHWASVYVETALRNKVILKSEEGDRFYPDAPITRKDMVLMICRALKLNPSDGSNPYFDLEESNGYFTKAYEEYLVRGIPMNGKIIFNPTGVTTRAQAAVIISRLVDYKADPAGFVVRMAMEERFANGTQTAEDIALKRELEIEKAKADPNYIMEPKIVVHNKKEDFTGMAIRRNGFDDDLFNSVWLSYAGYIELANYEDYMEGSPNIEYKLLATDKGKELLNTKVVVDEPFISINHMHVERTDERVTMKDNIFYDVDLNTHVMRFIMRDDEDLINKKFVNYDDYNKVGETLNYKLYLKRGNNTKEYSIKFKVN